MSSEQEHHEEVVNTLYHQLQGIFESSDQAIYLYLDDTHKVCNSKFATLLGYRSPNKFAEIESMLETHVDQNSRHTLVSAYKDAMEKKAASKIDVKLKTTSGSTVDTSFIMVPLTYQGHLLILHFVSKNLVS